MLDMRSVILSSVVLDVVCFLVVTVLWRQNRERFRGLGLLTMDYAFQSVGITLIVLRGCVPDWLSVIVSNLLVVTGALMGLWGVECFVGHSGRRGWPLAGLLLFALVHIGLSVMVPHAIPLRSANIALALLVICVLCARRLLCCADETMRRATRCTGFVFASYAIFFWVRIFALLVYADSATDYLRSGITESVFMLLTETFFVLLTYSLILMVNRCLILDIRFREEKYAKAFHNAPYAIVLTRLADGKIIEANETCARYAGVPHASLVGATTLDLALWPSPEARQRMVQALDERGRLSDFEIETTTRVGERFVGLFSVEPITVNNERCLLSTFCDITARKRAEEERERLVAERERALAEVKTLRGLLPICSSCKKIRDAQGTWHPVEAYMQTHSQAEFSHGLCPECLRTLYPDAENRDP